MHVMDSRAMPGLARTMRCHKICTMSCYNHFVSYRVKILGVVPTEIFYLGVATPRAWGTSSPQDPLAGGWFFRIRLSNAGELDGLMDEAAYKAYIEELD